MGLQNEEENNFLINSLIKNYSLEFSIKYDNLGSGRLNGVLSSPNINFLKMKKFILVVNNDNGKYDEIIDKIAIGNHNNQVDINYNKSTNNSNSFKPATYSGNWFEGQSTKDILVVVVPIVLIIIYCLKSC
jgi:hypothetical protein